MIETNKIEWLEPWVCINGSGQVFINELFHEVNFNHPLFNVDVNAVARREDCDDVLFELVNSDNQFAVVHLTWCKSKDLAERYPTFNLYKDIDDWIGNGMKVNHKDFIL